MRIRRVVSHAIRPASSPPEASRSTSNPPIRSPIITVVVKAKVKQLVNGGKIKACCCSDLGK